MMTQTVRQAESNLDAAMADSVPRRRLSGRFSAAHLIMALAGLLAFLLALVVLRDGAATTFLARAAGDIPAGTTVGAADVELVEVTGDALAGVALDADEVNEIITAGDVATRALPAGTLLQPNDFAPAGPEVDIRSMSIPVAPGRAVGGSLQPGDHVDVVATDAGGSWHAAAGLEVVAVADAGTGAFSAGDYTVTVAVDPATSLRLACAMANFSIDVVRSTGAPPLKLPPPPDQCG